MIRLQQIFIAISAAAMVLLPSSTKPEPPVLRITTAQSTDPHAQTIAQATVVCENANACPSGVGMLVASSGKTLNECTVFLIDSQTVITNSHCLPKEIRKENAECGASVGILFPASGDFKAERAACAMVIRASRIDDKASQDFVKKPDYAILRLAAKTKRAPLKVSRAGLPDGLKLQVYSVDPTSTTSLKGVLRMKTCAATQGSLLAPSFVQKNAPVGVFDNCNILAGDSGSPAVDADGNVRAVVHATLAARKGKFRAQKFDSMALMTNLACTDIGNDHPAIDCGRAASSVDLVRMALTKVSDRALSQLAAKWASPQNLQFSANAPEGSEHVLAPVLECVKSISELEAHKGKIIFQTPVWGFSAQPDSAYRVKLQASKTDSINVVVSFDAKMLSRRGVATARARSKSLVTGEVTNDASFTLEMCEPIVQQASK